MNDDINFEMGKQRLTNAYKEADVSNRVPLVQRYKRRKAGQAIKKETFSERLKRQIKERKFNCDQASRKVTKD